MGAAQCRGLFWTVLAGERRASCRASVIVETLQLHLQTCPGRALSPVERRRRRCLPPLTSLLPAAHAGAIHTMSSRVLTILACFSLGFGVFWLNSTGYLPPVVSQVSVVGAVLQ